MNARKAAVLAAWLCSLAAAGAVALHAHYITDLSAFLPAHPTPQQRILVEQLRDGPASRLLLIGIEGGSRLARAAVSIDMGRRLRADPEFASVSNGQEASADRDREFLFAHRYLLSDAVDARHFSAAGLEAAMRDTVADLASPEGLIVKSLVPHDPTGETLHIIDRLSQIPAPQLEDGVWASRDGTRALLVAQTAAAGSDTDAQEHAIGAAQAAFATAVGTTAARATGVRDVGAPAKPLQLRLSGPGVFAVASRAEIERAAVRLSIASSALIVLILLAVYRSLAALLLGLLPVATGALVGIAAVALVFGAVHGITLGFGVTLIGESVDYSIYFFIQSAGAQSAGAQSGGTQSVSGQSASGNARAAYWQRRLWPTMRLGMLTSVCGFATLLPSGFPGLAQLGAYSISGLIAAAAVTRFILPELLPRRFAIRDLAPLGARVTAWLEPARRARGRAPWALALTLAGVALLVLVLTRATLWNRELSRLSPPSPEQQRIDAELRADLGAPDSLDLVVVSGASLEAALRGAERTALTLAPLTDAHVIGGIDSPSDYLPSLATQAARRNSLPPAAELRANLDRAARELGLDSHELAPFLDDVETARHASLLAPADFSGTSLAAGLGALLMHSGDRWSALLPLRAAPGSASDIDLVPVRAALAAAGLAENAAAGGTAVGGTAAGGTAAGDPAASVHVLDLKRESDALYDEYLHEAMRLSLLGLAAIVALLWFALRSLKRAALVLAPLVLAVLTVAAVLALCGIELTILHLVGMLLIVAVGSNYALFFDRRDGEGSGSPLTLASLALANLCTVIGFGLLSFSGVPVLEALGTTVAPGAFLALLYAALLTRHA
jgi:predicted exporter